MGSQYSLALTIKKTEHAGEIISSASVGKTSGGTAVCSTGRGGSNDAQLVIPVPRDVDIANEFYLYLPMHRKELIRSGISVVQDEVWNYQRAVIPMKRLLESKIHELNIKTAQTEEAISHIIGIGEQKCTDTPNVLNLPDVFGASKIYKCRVLDDGKQVEMKKVCSSTYFWLRDESLSRGTVLKTKLDWSSDTVDQCSSIDWKTIFKLLQTVKSFLPQSSAIQKCLEMQQQIDQLKIVFDEMEPRVDELNESEIALVHKNYSKRQELEAKINAACSKILFGK